MKKKALITGASRGIGAECARKFAAAGFHVVINYNISEKAALALAEETGGEAVRADVSDLGQVESMFRKIGHIDVLVCNAGIALQRLFTDITPAEWRNMFAVNVDGVYNCCRSAIPSMVHEKNGRIITVSSMWGITGASCESAYSSTKAAIIGLTKSLAKELGPSGITVNCVAPGVIATEMNRSLPDNALDALRGETPLGVIGSPADVANAVLFLASASSSFITGQVISPNGGFLI